MECSTSSESCRPMNTDNGSSHSKERLTVSITGPASFDGVVTYLGVRSDRIRELHQRLVETVSPAPELIQQYRELDCYTPHLTLGQTHWGITEQELDEMKLSAEWSLAPFPAFTVENIRVYQEIEKDMYAPYEDIELMQTGCRPGRSCGRIVRSAES